MVNKKYALNNQHLWYSSTVAELELLLDAAAMHVISCPDPFIVIERELEREMKHIWFQKRVCDALQHGIVCIDITVCTCTSLVPRPVQLFNILQEKWKSLVSEIT